MIRNIKRTFPPKTGLQEKQVLQDPGYVKTLEIHAACCMLHAACSVQNNVKDIKDIKTSHNRFPWVYFIIVGDIKDVYELQCRF